MKKISMDELTSLAEKPGGGTKENLWTGKTWADFNPIYVSRKSSRNLQTFFWYNK